MNNDSVKLVRLAAGERFLLSNPDAFVRLVSGQAEVYAVTRNKSSFRRIFLIELAENEAAFPSLDEFNKIDILIYAKEDAELIEIPLDNVENSELVIIMRRWFQALMSVSWLQLIADRGDEMLLLWKDGNVFGETQDDRDALMEEFAEHEGIFAMLLGARFRSEDARLRERLAIREHQSTRLLNESVANLLGENLYEHRDNSEYISRAKLQEVVFIVQSVANALSMPTENINIAPEIVSKQDQFGILRRLVQKGNMQMRLITLNAGWHKKDSGVMIGYFNPTEEKKELAALVPVTLSEYLLITKENPKGIPITDELAEKLDKDAFACYGGLPLRKLTLLDLFRFAFRSSWKHDRNTILLVSIIAGIIPLITPVITETIFQDIIPILDREGLATVTQVSMISGFTIATFNVVRSIANLRFVTHLDMSVEAAMWGRLLALPSQFFRKLQTGNLANRMQSMDAVKMAFMGEMPTKILNFIFSFWSLLLMLYYSIPLTIMALVLWLIYGIFMYRILGKLTRAQREMTNAKNATSGIVQQIFAGLSKFRVQGMEEQAYYLWSKIFGEEWKWNYESRWQTNYMNILAVIQPMLLSLLLYYIVFYKVNDEMGVMAQDGISYATFLAFHAAYTGFNSGLNAMLPAISQIMAVKPHLENLQPILEAVPELSEDRVDADQLSGAIEIRNLTFSYAEGTRNVLDNVTLRITAGENVAIVGRSGSGKSTLLRLLLGFETPKSGAVYYDGQDLSGLSLSSVRSQMGVVLQNGQLMSGDIFTNIVGTTALTQDDAWAAAEAAGIAEDIRQMPMGMQTMISEGSTNISGGQRQRILIARALAARPAIIIFDEATSALDNRTQAIVTESLERMKATRIVVAHRLSTIRNCDRIIVMDGGHVAESGTFDELVAQGGLFAGLVRRQIA